MAVGQLKCEVANRAAMLIARHQKTTPVSVEDTEDSLDRVSHPIKHRLHNLGPEVLSIPLQNGQ